MKFGGYSVAQFKVGTAAVCRLYFGSQLLHDWCAIGGPTVPTDVGVYAWNQTSVYESLYAGPANPVTDPPFNTFTGNSNVQVSWNTPLSNGGSPITGYRVKRFGEANHPSQIVSAGTYTRVYLNETWTPRGCNPYVYVVSAINSQGESVGVETPALYMPQISPAPVLRLFRVVDYGSNAVTHRLAWAQICDPDENGGLRQVLDGNVFADPQGPGTDLPFTHWQIQWQQTFYNNWGILLPDQFTSPYLTCAKSVTSFDVLTNGDPHQRKYRIRTALEAGGQLYYGNWSNVEIGEP